MSQSGASTMQFFKSEEYCVLQNRIESLDVTNNVKGQFKVLKIPYNLLDGERFQHIVKHFAEQYKLLYSDYVAVSYTHLTLPTKA